MNSTFLKNLLSQPTAPYCEFHVLRFLKAAFERHRIAYFQDRFGNLVAGAKDPVEYRRKLRTAHNRPHEPLRLFIAHMDHPGFHVLSQRNQTLQAQWHGGSPTQALKNAKVWLADADASQGFGKIKQATLNQIHRRAIDRLEIEVDAATAKKISNQINKGKRIFGGFGFRKSIWRRGKVLYTKAADDLVGCYIMFELAKTFHRHPQFLALFTRAEETGFMGAIAHFSEGALNKMTEKKSVLCISLETSRQLPQAELGKGPIVRLGDRMTVFHANSLRVFSEIAQKTLPKNHQKRIMDGGACEATVATAWGFPAVGISVPLGNYHNQNFEGGPDALGKKGGLGPAPEFVHSEDVQRALALAQSLMKKGLPWKDAWSPERNKMTAAFHQAKQLMFQDKNVFMLR